MRNLIIDITENRKAAGFAEIAGYGDCSVRGTQEGRTWHLVAGTSDEFRAHGSSLLIAAKRLAKAMGITEGWISLGDDRKGTDAVDYDLTGKPVELPATPVPTFDDFVAATSGAVRAALSAPEATEVKESASVDGYGDPTNTATPVNYTMKGGQRTATHSRTDRTVTVFDGVKLIAVVPVAADVTPGEVWEIIKSAKAEDTHECGTPHADYPHTPGYLYDCAACEAECHCAEESALCVWSGHDD